MSQINLHPGQSRVYQDLFVDRVCRFQAVCCSRGWGKSFEAVAGATTAIYELMALDLSVPNKNVAIIAPTYDQVTDIYWPLIMYEFGLESVVIKASRDLGRFVFPNAVELRLLSYESVERMRGKGYYFVAWDEISSCSRGLIPQKAWEGVIQPTIITRWSPERAKHFGAPSPGRAQIITTPKGYNFFYDMYHYYEQDPLWRSYHFDYTTSPFLDVDEIDRIKHNIDPIEFASEYLASFQESGNSVFYCFDRKVHVRADLPDFEKDPQNSRNEDVHCAVDFNVGIMAASFSAIRGNQAHILDEVQGHPDTETLAEYIRDVYIYKNHKVYVYPDPTGKSRKTSSPVGRTDYSILESVGCTIRARSKNPPIVDSVNAVNRKLMTAGGDVSCYIHPRCTGVIKSLERTRWTDKNPDSMSIDKTEGVEHYSDGIRYKFEYLFPVTNVTKRVSRGFGF
jgi:hypothetical protein